MGLNVLSLTALCAYSLVMLIAVTGASGKPMAEDTPSLEEMVNETLHRVEKIEQVVDEINNYDERCPASDGFFFAPGTGQFQCLRVMGGKQRDWYQAKAFCENKNGTHHHYGQLRLARPLNAGELALYLFEGYYPIKHFWMNAKGFGHEFNWLYSQEKGHLAPVPTISNISPLWTHDEPGDKTTVDYCLELLTGPENLKNYPGRPYNSLDCTSEIHTLCEKPLNPLMHVPQEAVDV